MLPVILDNRLSVEHQIGHQLPHRSPSKHKIDRRQNIKHVALVTVDQAYSVLVFQPQQTSVTVQAVIRQPVNKQFPVPSPASTHVNCGGYVNCGGPRPVHM